MFSKLLFTLFTIIIAHNVMAQSLWPQRGTFMLTSRTNGNEALGVLDGRAEPGARIAIMNTRSAPKGSVIWSFEFDNMLINKRSKLALTVHKPNSNSSVTPGTNLVQGQVNTSSTTIVQNWNYFAGTGQIHPGFAGGLCITAANQLNGAVATIQKCGSNLPEQTWTVAALPRLWI